MTDMSASMFENANDIDTANADAGIVRESTASATWSRMLAGNRRFAEGKPEHPWQDAATRESLVDGQHPDAVVLSCGDSRVPPEIIFDQGLGDMFTVRTAGHMIDEAVIASVEYAVNTLGVSLIVVMGHEGCGAVALACQEVQKLCDSMSCGDGSAESVEEYLQSADSVVLRSVGMSVWQAGQAEVEDTDDIERVHIARTIEALVTESSVVQEALAQERAMIVGARYQLSSGKVEVLSF